MSETPKPTEARICVAIPIFGGANMGAANLAQVMAGTIFALGRQLDVMCGDDHWTDGPISVEPAPTNGSFEHSRADLVARFLEHPRRYTHLLFWDSDIVPPPVGGPKAIAELLTRLLRCRRDYIGVPYALKAIDWTEVASAANAALVAASGKGPTQYFTAPELMTAGLRYSPDLRKNPRGRIEEDGCAEMDRVPLGFALLRRSVLEKMTECYKSSLSYRRGGEPIVGMFKTVMEEKERHPDGYPIHVLVDEDYSFSDRWRRIGGKQFLYLGEGAPLGHVGTYIFQGTNAHVRMAWLPERKADDR
jgi:hypothetical protein